MATTASTAVTQKELATEDNIERLAKRNNDDDDALFEELENDDSQLANMRERRMEQLKREIAKVEELRAYGNGTYTEVTQEKEILAISTTVPFSVVHFYHKEFRRCQIMDKHLESLSRKHFKTKFCKISVENAPFLVEKLKIQVLPCLVAFVNGVSVDRIIGFEELGNNDNFATPLLEFRLSNCGVITMKQGEDDKKPKRKTIYGFEHGEDGYSDDSD